MNYDDPRQAVESEDFNIDYPFPIYYLLNNKDSDYKMTKPSEEKLRAARIELENNKHHEYDGGDHSSHRKSSSHSDSS